MALERGKGAVAPHEQNPNPTPKTEPNKDERKISKKKQKKIDLEELKKELVMVRKPRMDADQLASKHFLNPQPFNILPTGPSHPSSPSVSSPPLEMPRRHHLFPSNSALFPERSQINFGTAERQVFRGPDKGG